MQAARHTQLIQQSSVLQHPTDSFTHRYIWHIHTSYTQIKCDSQKCNRHDSKIPFAFFRLHIGKPCPFFQRIINNETHPNCYQQRTITHYFFHLVTLSCIFTLPSFSHWYWNHLLQSMLLLQHIVQTEIPILFQKIPTYEPYNPL